MAKEQPQMQDKPELTPEAVRRVAYLSRLEISDEQVREYAEQLRAILDHMTMLQELDLEGVSPMAHPPQATNRWDADEPQPGLPNEVVQKLAPESAGPFIKVPKVIGGGELS